jgi:hypothetical protein
MADETQEKQLQYVLFSFGASRAARQQLFSGGPIVVYPLWFPPEGVSSEQLKQKK